MAKKAKKSKGSKVKDKKKAKHGRLSMLAAVENLDPQFTSTGTSGKWSLKVTANFSHSQSEAIDGSPVLSVARATTGAAAPQTFPMIQSGPTSWTSQDITQVGGNDILSGQTWAPRIRLC